MSTLSLLVQQSQLAQPSPLNPDALTTDPSLLAAIDACAAEFQLPDQTDGGLWEYQSPLSTTLPTCDPRDPELSNPNLSLGGNAPATGDSHDYSAQLDLPANHINQPLHRSSNDDHSQSNSKSHSRGGSSTNSNSRTGSRRQRNLGHSASTSSSSSSKGTEDASSQRARLLERNRIAASKCRQRKREQTMNLESRFKEQSRKKDALMAKFARLRMEVLGLKNEVLKHASCGDASISRHLSESAAMSVSHYGPGPGLPAGDGGLSSLGVSRHAAESPGSGPHPERYLDRYGGFDDLANI